MISSVLGWGRAMAQSARELGLQILIQRPTGGNVDQLDAPANAKERKLVLQRLTGQDELCLVEGVVYLAQLGMRLLAIDRRIDVHSARKQ